MAKYQFQINDDGSTVEAALKVLSMLQDEDYSVSVDSDKHVLTITAGEKDAQRKAIKKELRKSRWKLFWKNAWKHISNWYDRKGYWVGMLLFMPMFGSTVGGDTAVSIMAGIAIDLWMIVFLMSDERK